MGLNFGMLACGCDTRPQRSLLSGVVSSLRGMVGLGRLPYSDLETAEVRRVSVNRQGYTSRGTYYGAGGLPVFEIEGQTESGRYIHTAIRASDMRAAKAAIKAQFPAIKFE